MRQGVLTVQQFFVFLHLVAPKPRPALPSEKTYITTSPKSPKPTPPAPLPCWYDRWLAERQATEEAKAQAAADTPAENQSTEATPSGGTIEPAELRLSVVFPAFNEEKRIIPTLEEAVEYLDAHIGRPNKPAKIAPSGSTKRHSVRHAHDEEAHGYEILVVNDGSTDGTVDVVLDFCREHELHDVIRIVSLENNRGKGGSVTHGLRHVRGEYALFADADGASRFSDVRKLIEGCEEVVDGSHRGVAIGSRAHLVGSDAVVKVSSHTQVLLATNTS